MSTGVTELGPTHKKAAGTPPRGCDEGLRTRHVGAARDPSLSPFAICLPRLVECLVASKGAATMLSTTTPLMQSRRRLRYNLQSEPEDWSDEVVRDELHRVLQSSQFDASERNRRFLSYVIEETLAGRADRIKAYNVATEVFGRDVNFDPQLDPVVRMEARRLR